MEAYSGSWNANERSNFGSELYLDQCRRMSVSDQADMVAPDEERPRLDAP